MLFCISCHASSGFAAFYVSKQSTAGSGLCFTSGWEKPSRALIHLGGPSRGTWSSMQLKELQFAKYITLCEHSTRQVSLQKDIRHLKEGWKKILNGFWRLGSRGGERPLGFRGSFHAVSEGTHAFLAVPCKPSPLDLPQRSITEVSGIGPHSSDSFAKEKELNLIIFP